MEVVGYVVLGLLALALGPLALTRLARRYGVDDSDDLKRIPTGGPKPKDGYDEHDEALRKRTEQRRDDAEKIRSEARQIETKDDRRSRIHRVC